ncbi:capsid protein [Streptococcus pneumoniae]|nr:capsid protein [Streptococcus pneumoniae]
MNNDFLEVLLDFINNLDLPLTARLDYLDENDALVIYALPGGKVDSEDMAGNQTLSLPYEIAIKSHDQNLVSSVLWTINTALSAFDLELSSTNNSYDFLSLSVEAPSINELNEQGFYIYLLDLTAKIEVERNY